MAAAHALTREEVVLAALALARGASHTPVQVQKLLFLLDRNAAAQLGGPHFRFEPYHYGPFDKAVYQTLEALRRSGQVEIERDAPWRNYRLTPPGQSRGEAALERIDPRVVDFARRTSDFVRGLPFAELVSAIYKAYPEMRARSVFQG